MAARTAIGRPSKFRKFVTDFDRSRQTYGWETRMKRKLEVRYGGDDNGGNSPGDPGNPVPQPEDDPSTPSE